jgi:hypothetical protein
MVKLHVSISTITWRRAQRWWQVPLNANLVSFMPQTLFPWWITPRTDWIYWCSYQELNPSHTALVRDFLTEIMNEMQNLHKCSKAMIMYRLVEKPDINFCYLTVLTWTNNNFGSGKQCTYQWEQHWVCKTAHCPITVTYNIFYYLSH